MGDYEPASLTILLETIQQKMQNLKDLVAFRTIDSSQFRVSMVAKSVEIADGADWDFSDEFGEPNADE